MMGRTPPVRSQKWPSSMPHCRRAVLIRNHFILCREETGFARHSARCAAGWVSDGGGGGGGDGRRHHQWSFRFGSSAAQDGLIISDLDKTKGREETGGEGAECSTRLTPANRSFSTQGGAIYVERTIYWDCSFSYIKGYVPSGGSK